MTPRLMRRRLLTGSVVAGCALCLTAGAASAASAPVSVTANVPPILTVTASTPTVNFLPGSTVFSGFSVLVVSNDHYSLGADRTDAAPLLSLPLSLRVPVAAPAGATATVTPGAWNSLAAPVTLGGRTNSWTDSGGDAWNIDFQNDLGTFPRAGSYGATVTFTASTVP